MQKAGVSAVSSGRESKKKKIPVLWSRAMGGGRDIDIRGKKGGQRGKGKEKKKI